MAKPITIPNTFASATSAIPLAQLDQDFSTLANATNDLATYSNYVADTGAADAYIANFPANTNTSSLTTGLTVQFKAANANTGASTLNVQVNGASIGTAAIRYANGSALAAGAIAAGAMVSVMYDGTNFQLINDPAGQSGGDVTGPASATDNAIARFDGASGKLIQNSVVTIADTTGDMAGVGNLSASNVTVSGTANAATLIVTGVGTFAAGSNTAPSITTTGDTNTGIFFPAADTIAFTEGGVESMRIDSSGNVGIGTSSPNSYVSSGGLAVAGNICAVNNSSIAADGNSRFQQVSGIGPAISGFQFAVYTGGSTGVSPTERMRIDSSGRVGIGTSSPAVGLQLAGTDANSIGQFRQTNTSANTTRAISVGNDSKWYFSQPAVADYMTIDSSGNVGIGMTPSGDSRLEVYSADSATIYKNVNTGTGANDGFYVGMGKSSLTEAYVYNRENNNIIFGTNNTERMRITSGGVLVVGVAGNGYGSGRIRYEGSDVDGVSGKLTGTSGACYVANIASTAQFLAYFVYQDSTEVGKITTNGTNTTYATSSDYRLKQNVSPMTGALEKVAQLKPCTFTWKSNGSAGQGFIAHELQEVVPDAVTGEKDAVRIVDIKDEEGNVIGQEEKPAYQGVDTSFLVATLTAAIQEMKAIIDEQAARISALESK